MEKKRFVSKLLALAMAVFMLLLSTPLTQPALFGNDSALKAEAISATKSGTFAKTLKWSFNKLTGKLTISGKGAIPNYYIFGEAQPWVNFNVLSLEIKNGVTSIGSNAFSYNSLISKVSVADSVSFVAGGNFDFSVWYSLLKNGPVYLGKCLYGFVGSAKSVKIKEGTLSISDNAFYEARVSSVVIPNSVKKIGIAAFEDSTVSSVTLSSSLKKIPQSMFSGCKKLTKITIPKAVTSIEDSAFLSTGLKSVDIPSNVKSIGAYAFADCKKLTEITLRNGLEKIGESAFDSALIQSATIPASVKTIPSSVFSNCKNLEKIGLDKNNKYFAVDKSGALYNKAKTKLIEFPRGSKLSSYSLASTTTVIGEYAFYNTTLKSITLPGKLKTIKTGAFEGCKNLEKIKFPTSLTSADDCGIEDTKWFKKQPDGIIYLNKIAYMYKTEEPDKIKTVSLKSDTISLGSGLFMNFASVKKIDLPKGLKKIGSGVFAFCESLTSINIPSTVTSIGDFAFYSCSSLKSVTLPPNIKTVKTNTFTFCESLTSIKIPSKVTSIEASAFDSASSLKSIVLPASVTKIEQMAFSGCEKLESVKIMNPLCRVDSFDFGGEYCTIPSGAKIIAHKGSSAQSYAKKNKNKFTALEPVSLEKCAVKAIADQKYTGKAITPEITVTYCGAKLKSGKDFDATFKNNTKKGTATVTLKGNEAHGFKGTIKASFKIK